MICANIWSGSRSKEGVFWVGTILPINAKPELTGRSGLVGAQVFSSYDICLKNQRTSEIRDAMLLAIAMICEQDRRGGERANRRNLLFMAD